MALTEADKTRVESYDIEASIEQMEEIVKEATELYYNIKQLKFDYLTTVVDLYSKVDHPILFMDNFAKNVNQLIM